MWTTSCMAWGLIAQAQDRAEQHSMELVGYHDLQGRSAYQPVVHAQGGRWIAYIGLHGGNLPNALTGKAEHNGTAILDVSDPRRPKWLAHIPGAPGAGAQMVRVCDGAELPRADKGRVYLLRTFGNSAHQVWDVTAPASPALLSTVAGGLQATHKSWWECDSGIAYLVSGVPGWRTSRMTQIYDLANPAKPVFIRNFGLPGQQPGSIGPVPTELHGPISTGPKGNRVYFGYGTSSYGILQIVDRDKLLSGPKAPTEENLLYPQVGRLDLGPDAGAHTAFPVLGMEVAGSSGDKRGQAQDFVVVTSESLAGECREPRQMAWMVDVSAEAKPRVVASWTVADAKGEFCRRGGRFGTHSSNESFAPIYYRRIMFFAHFNAGVRAVDIRDPYHPKEVGYYIPAANSNTDTRCIGGGRCKRVTQTNNVEVDERGYIYMVDRAHTGMHVVELSGPARAIAALK
ncbi:MAG: LVIVD repeat-containing protein [Burkholderiales bacterium]